MIIGRCVSCGGNVTTSMIRSEFKCPACLKGSILRCENCKVHGNPYTCAECNFVGP